ncbi:hypothetical protein TSMEX_001063 [Taenia solium]|eukprot:TsM_000761300 transcript=TsM_000761300 gene=TsM_000761300
MFYKCRIDSLEENYCCGGDFIGVSTFHTGLREEAIELDVDSPTSQAILTDLCLHEKSAQLILEAGGLARVFRVPIPFRD